jgi:hypothetical protein
MFSVAGTTVDCFRKIYDVETSDGKVFKRRCVKDNRKVKVMSLFINNSLDSCQGK